jgi:hypothetical protein
MVFEDAERQIASIDRSLSKAKASAVVVPNNPALPELERTLAPDGESIFFADIDEENSEARRFSPQ